MKSTFRILTNHQGMERNYLYDFMVFSGGEINVRVSHRSLEGQKQVTVHASIADSEGVMTLALLKDAIDRALSPVEVHLRLGYVPYARQDRVCNPGESLAIKVFCDMVNAMNFKSVLILDAHSDVTPALINNCREIAVEQILKKSGLASKLFAGCFTLVAPDAGATKKIDKVAQMFGGLEVIQGIKKRDTKTGQLTGFGFIGEVKGKDLLIVDDICDGGGTFIGLGMQLKEAGAKSLTLYVSHGIFSKGIDPLINSCFDGVHTTDSFDSGIEHLKLKVTPWS